MNKYDLIVVGSGAAGMISAIVAARAGKNVLLCEQQAKLGPKLKLQVVANVILAILFQMKTL